MSNRLYAIRTARKMSVKELALKSGISKTAIYSIENPNHPYKTREEVAFALAKALDVRVEQIFDETELSDNGRTPWTGTPTRTVKNKRTNPVCIGCRIELPNTGKCDTCTDTIRLSKAG